jgi:RNA-directed DNA polymerase
MPHPFAPSKIHSGSISNKSSLAAALDVSEADLDIAAGQHSILRYDKKTVAKSGGRERTVYNPHQIVRKVQDRINSRLFKRLIIWPDYLYGSIPNIDASAKITKRDYIACAAQHCGSKSLLKVDVENFFENIHIDFIVEIFCDFFKYPSLVSQILADICCFHHSLVQGALTSSYLATLCLWDVEFELVTKLRRKKLVYTRLVDDITVSSKRNNFDFEDVTHQIRIMLLEKGLPLNSNKTKTLYSGIAPIEVHGLRVNFPTPRLPAAEVNNIRAAVHNVTLMSKANNFRTSNTYRKYYDRCIGRVNKLARVGHDQHAPMLRKLIKIKPLPSYRDIEKMDRALKKLVSLHSISSNTRYYSRRYAIALYRNGIIARTFSKQSKDYSDRLRAIPPTS